MQYAAVWHLYLLLNAFIVIIFLSGFGGFRQNVQQYQHVVALCAVLARAIGKGLTFQKVCLMFVFVCFVLLYACVWCVVDLTSVFLCTVCGKSFEMCICLQQEFYHPLVTLCA